MFLHITEVRYLHDYVVEVAFNDGRRGTANLSDALRGPVFSPLKDQARFAALRVDPESETITWPNGADLAPEYVYFQAFKDDPALQHQFQTWGYLA